MIYEVAHLTIDPTLSNEFEAAVAGCGPLFRGAVGCRSMRLEREIEDPARYRLVVGWESVEAHMIGFRESPAFAEWRAAVGPFFVEPPRVAHTTIVVAPF